MFSIKIFFSIAGDTREVLSRPSRGRGDMLQHGDAADRAAEHRPSRDADEVSLLHGELPQTHLRHDLLAGAEQLLEAGQD